MNTQKPTIHLIVAARPNFMKVAPLYHELIKQGWCNPLLVHTGQHYDANMSGNFLRDLNLPQPDIHLSVGSGTHAEQTAGVMLAYEKVCLEQAPDYIIVVGDVNSTLAVTITAKKLWLPVAHLEAGLRSGDRSMPEEINRIVTDALCDLLWTPSPDGDEHLLREGVSPERVVRVGNIMLDSYELLREKIEADSAMSDLGLTPKGYGVVTLHRDFNVDRQEALSPIVDLLIQAAKKLPLVFPVHPRTRARLETFGLWDKLEGSAGMQLVEPLGYIPFMNLVGSARLVLTDSGGIQEETTYLDVPCLTMRPNTERPITITEGTNKLVDVETALESIARVLSGDWPTGTKPALWDGKTAGRVADSLKTALLK
ncbi:MAG: UDP-N-acetylglucosamine 2-epimerase (non-hydrolyzing) [Chloroflexota bacterium]